MRWLALVTCLSGCVFFDSDDAKCRMLDSPARLAPVEPVLHRNPDTLQCESISSGCPCGAACTTEFAPEQSWPVCGTSCESLGEGDCAADPACRVVKDANCGISTVCITDFLGCFPVDTEEEATLDCFTADAWNCSRSNKCTAFHSHEVCDSQTCDRPFELCVPEGTHPGTCTGSVACDAAPPNCGAGKTPGIADGCYTGACIPNHLCGT